MPTTGTGTSKSDPKTMLPLAYWQKLICSIPYTTFGWNNIIHVANVTIFFFVTIFYF